MGGTGPHSLGRGSICKDCQSDLLRRDRACGAAMAEPMAGPLSKQPELINQEPYGEGWIARLTPDSPEQSVALLDAAAYQAKTATGSGH